MNTNQEEIKLYIERLVQFGLQHQLLEHWDAIPATNALLELLNVAEPYSGAPIEQVEPNIAELLSPILDFAVEQGILKANTTTSRDLLDAKIMGLLMPRQSEVIRRFWKTAEDHSIQQATDEYYQLSIDSNYIRMDRIAKNQYWLTPTDYGNLEITVNLSKPEKDPREIALERSLPQSSYPKCLLCLENVGYSGRLNHPARQNHRVIPLQLLDSTWFLQYSPYVYYNEHNIIFSSQHSPMRISEQTFSRLLDFVRQFPHYFIGSNADLPIVGGSILNHDHFQGGRHSFPMEKAEVVLNLMHSDFPDVTIGLVKWPMSVIRISSSNPQALISLATRIFETWQDYNDPAVEIEAISIIDGVAIPHNTVTPIARMNKAGEYELDLVLRNNRTTEQHPYGLFHPHEPLHHIKKENIGLIEVMGLAVLPGRLQVEMQQIARILAGEIKLDAEILGDNQHILFKHILWIEQLVHKYGVVQSVKLAEGLLQKEVGTKFLAVLSDAGIFKRDKQGMESFVKFMINLGCSGGVHLQ